MKGSLTGSEETTLALRARGGNGSPRLVLARVPLAVPASDRFLLARESVLTAMVGCRFVGSLWTSRPPTYRPQTYRLTRPLPERTFSRNSRSWESFWDREPRFRRNWYVSTAIGRGHADRRRARHADGHDDRRHHPRRAGRDERLLPGRRTLPHAPRRTQGLRRRRWTPPAGRLPTRLLAQPPERCF